MMHDSHNDQPLGQDFGWELTQLRQETLPKRAEIDAIQHRLRQHTGQQGRMRGAWLTWLSAGSGAVAVAAGLLAWVLSPSPPQTQQIELVSAERINRQVHDDVALDFSGRGQLEATGKTHTISWQEGLLKVSVKPEQGILLDVTTPEASVSVVGTVFDVQRDLTGTTVSVERGKVAVRCGTDPALLLVAEDEPVFCRTNSPAGLATLTRQLLEEGDLDGALAISAEGLSVAPQNSYATAELHWNRTLIYVQRSAWLEALSSAEALLATGQESFAISGHQAAARAGREAGGCSLAQPHLQWLADEQEATATELAHLADCLVATDPEQAANHLREAMTRTDDPALKQQLEHRHNQLGM